MNIKKIINSIWASIKNMYLALRGEVKQTLPIIVQTIENIKTYQDDGSIDAMTAIIPGEADNWLAAQLRTVLPKLLKSLHLCAQLDDPNEELKCAIKNLQLSSDDAKDILLHGLASKLMELTSNGKLQWKNVIGLAEFIFQTFFKKKAVIA